MSTSTVTICGRYGKKHGEPFLRRRSTDEPMLTPHRYYFSDADYRESQSVYGPAWEIWKNERYGAAAGKIPPTPFFELADRELKETYVLLKQADTFQEGLNRLEERVRVAEEAGERLEEAKRNGGTGKDEMVAWAEQIRRGPPLLASLCRRLRSGEGEKMGESLRILDEICDDGCAAASMAPPGSPAQSTVACSFTAQLTVLGPAKTANRQSAQYPLPFDVERARGPSRRGGEPSEQGDEFGLAHDPGEEKGGTIIPGNTCMILPRPPSLYQSQREILMRLRLFQVVSLCATLRTHGETRLATDARHNRNAGFGMMAVIRMKHLQR